MAPTPPWNLLFQFRWRNNDSTPRLQLPLFHEWTWSLKIQTPPRNASSLHLFLSLVSTKKMRPLLQESGYHKTNGYPGDAFSSWPHLILSFPEWHSAVSEVPALENHCQHWTEITLSPSLLSSYSLTFKNKFPHSLFSFAQTTYPIASNKNTCPFQARSNKPLQKNQGSFTLLGMSLRPLSGSRVGEWPFFIQS